MYILLVRIRLLIWSNIAWRSPMQAISCFSEQRIRRRTSSTSIHNARTLYGNFLPLSILVRPANTAPSTSFSPLPFNRVLAAETKLMRKCIPPSRRKKLGNLTLNTNTLIRVPNTTLQQTSSPDISTVCNTHYNRTSWTTQHALSSDHLPIITTIKIRHDYRLQQNLWTFTNYKKADWTQFTEDRVRFRSDHHTHQHTHCQQNFHKHHTDGRQAQHTKGQDALQLQALARRHCMQNHTKK